MNSDYIEKEKSNPILEYKDKKYFVDPRTYPINISIQLSEDHVDRLNSDRVLVAPLSEMVGTDDEGNSLVNTISQRIKNFIGSEIFLTERTDNFMSEPLHFLFHSVSVKAPIPGNDSATVDSLHVGLALPSLGYHLQNHKSEIDGFPNYQMVLDQSGRKDIHFTDKCAFAGVLNTSNDHEVTLVEPQDILNGRPAGFHVSKDGKVTPGANSYHLAYVNPDTVHPTVQPVLSNQVVAGRDGSVTTEHLMTVTGDSWIATWSEQVKKSSLVGQNDGASKVIKVQELLEQKKKFYERQGEQRSSTLDNIAIAFGLPQYVTIPSGSTINLTFKATINGIYPQDIIDKSTASMANYSRLKIVSTPLNEHD